MKSPTENPGLLAIIADDDVAASLIVTWPNVYAAMGYDGDQEAAKGAEIIEMWADLAGVMEMDVENYWAKLFGNGFCSRDGTVDAVADAYVRNFVSGRLAKKKQGGQR